MVVVFVVAGIHLFCFEDGIIGNCVAIGIMIFMLVGGRIDEYVSSSLFFWFYVIDMFESMYLNFNSPDCSLSLLETSQNLLHSSRQYEDNLIQLSH